MPLRNALPNFDEGHDEVGRAFSPESATEWSSINASHRNHCGTVRRTSTQTPQFAIGRPDMLRIVQTPSAARLPQPPLRNLRGGAESMRLGMTLPARRRGKSRGARGVIAGLVPAISIILAPRADYRDGPRIKSGGDKPGHDQIGNATTFALLTPAPANSLFRRMNSLFGPRNSLFSSEQGIQLQPVDSSSNFSADRTPKAAKTSRNLANSLLISLLSGNLRPRPVEAHSRVSLSIEPSPTSLTPVMLSSPGLTGRSSKHRPWILDCPVKPGNDGDRTNTIEKMR